MRATKLAPLFVIALGCEKQEPPKPPVQPIAIRFGDCASASVAWISGPRPMAFTLAQAEGNWPAPEVAEPTVVNDPPPPPPRPPAAGKRDPRIALLEVENRMVLENILAKDADLGKFGGPGTGVGTAGSGVGTGTIPGGHGTALGVGTGTRRGGHGASGGSRPAGPASDGVAMADLLTAGEPDPGSLAGGYWFGAASQAVSVWGGPGNAYASRRGVFRPRNAGLQSPERYTPGAANPFAAHAAALSDCLQRGSGRYGAFVIELAFGPAGTVTTAATLGLHDEAAKACMIELAQTMTRPANVGPSERCSIAYGAMPLAVEHPLTLDGEKLTSDGKPIDFDTLGALLGARVAAATGDQPGTLQLFGPIVLEPTDATPMKSIYRATREILDAGDDFVLARHAPTWKLLVPLELPVVPVPLGTGGRWNRYRASQPEDVAPTARTDVTLTVQPQQITLAVDAKRTVFPRDAMLHDALSAALRALKASSEFSGRTDLELAGSDDATYADLLALVDFATATGFVDWQLTTPLPP
jgi:hypothetical protein